MATRTSQPTDRGLNVKYLEFSTHKLAALIEQRGWDEAYFAKLLRHFSPPRLKTSKQSVNLWCTHQCKPNIDYLPALAVVLGLKKPFEELYEEKTGSDDSVNVG